MSTAPTMRRPANGWSASLDASEETEPYGATAGVSPVELGDASAAFPNSTSPSAVRRDLNAMLGDGAAYSVMVGVGEHYLPAFALAMGMGEVVAGLIACVPLLAGAILQLVSPYGVRMLGSYRRWVSMSAAVQAASFLPLVTAAWIGSIPVALLFIIAGTYWGAGMSAGPAWSAWATSIVPARIRPRFFACRNRVSQAGVLVGFVGGGIALQFGASLGSPLTAFAAIFAAAGICRFISSRLLAAQSEPVPPGHDMHIVSRREILARLKNHGEGRLLFYLWAMYATAQIGGPYFTPFILGQLQYDYATYMLILATSILAKTLAMPILGRFAHRYGSRRLMIVGGIAMIPLPLFWLVSTSIPYLLCVQVVAGCAWAAYELAIILMTFDCIPASHRTSMLTVYNLGYAIVSVAGSLVGGLLLKLGGETYTAYLVVFAVSAAGRLLTLPLLSALPHKIREDDPAAEATDAGLLDRGISVAPQPAVAP